MENVSDQLLVGIVEDVELFELVSRQLHQAQFTSRTRIDLPNSDAPRMSFLYTKKGKLDRVESTLPDSDIQAIAAEVRDKLVEMTGTQFGQKLLFSTRPFSGKWRGNGIALVEAPQQAPRPPWIMGDHPLILEFPVALGTDGFVNGQRTERLAYRHVSLLALFLTDLKLPPRSARHTWALAPSDAQQVKMPPAQWVQEDYWYEGFQPLRVSPTADLIDHDAPTMPDAEYYQRHGIGPDDVMVIPESLGSWLDKARDLPLDEQQRLHRAAYWIRHSEETYTISASACLISAIQAVEALIESGGGTPCPTCGLQTGNGPTKRFKEFIDTFAQANDTETQAIHDLLYKERSKLTHGKTLLLTDADIAFGWSSPLQSHQYDLVRQAVSVARTAAINWLDRL